MIQVWVPSLSEREDMEGVVQKAFRFERLGEYTQDDELAQMAGPMLDFAWWFNNRVRLYPLPALGTYSRALSRGDEFYFLIELCFDVGEVSNMAFLFRDQGCAPR